MSRCFPFPPPRFAPTSAGKEALIESIKFQKEKVNVNVDKQRKKDKKKEKKAKSKEKKDERNLKQDSSNIVQGCIDGKLWADAKADFLLKGSSYEPEQLERSSLTEEHAKPVCLRVPSSSSDSTENSNKRKRLPSPVDSRGHGNVIRLRLPSKKKNQPDALMDEQKHFSTSLRTQFPPQAYNETAPRHRSEGFCSTSGSATVDVGKSFGPKTGGQRNHLVSKQTENAPVHLPASDPVLTPIQKECLLYRNLIENWAPPRFQDVCIDNPDEDWLFGGVDKKVERSEKAKSTCREESMSYCNTSSLWPCAQYLPEVDIYALAYTLPF